MCWLPLAHMRLTRRRYQRYRGIGGGWHEDADRGSAPAWLAQGYLDDHLAKGATLTNAGERLGYVVEPVRAINVDLYVA